MEFNKKWKKVKCKNIDITKLSNEEKKEELWKRCLVLVIL